MLVLTRKLNQQITIGDKRITITVVDVRGNRVRLGIQAPQEVRIERAEVLASEASKVPQNQLVNS